MKITLRKDLLQFAENASSPRVSIYFPTYRLGADVQQNVIRFKNQLRVANQRLEELGFGEDEKEHLLRPLESLRSNDPLWQNQLDGFAAFSAGGEIRHFNLPFTVNESVHVGSDFRFRPLFPWFTEGEKFILLALNLNGIELYEGDRYLIEKVALPESIPASLKEAMQYDEADPAMSFHSGGNAPTHQSHRHGAMFHGDGGEKDVRKDQILRFFREVDRGLHTYLQDKNCPLLTAGVEYLHPIYEEANTYGKLRPENLPGAPENKRLEELHGEAVALLEPQWEKALQEQVERFRNHALAGETGDGKVADQVEALLPAAYQGRVDTLIYHPTAQIWGKFDPQSGEIDPGPRDENGNIDLIELAALHTLKHGGSVHLDGQGVLPSEFAMAAVLRF
ncbi:MAG: hypothetical protein JJT75_08205 [Opitutales bacterium]|nr:hypothetical protein [Opitutales bacterium]MCH8541898.1 hypothetical protein [Opitutales bacterium]